MSANIVALAYLIASVFFILALKGLSSPLSARRGNLFGMVGMGIAVLTTLTITKNWALILGCIAVGGFIGAVVARRVQMTAMPELVAFMHSLVGLAAVFIAIAAVHNPVSFNLPEPLPMGSASVHCSAGTSYQSSSGSSAAYAECVARAIHTVTNTPNRFDMRSPMRMLPTPLIP